MVDAKRAGFRGYPKEITNLPEADLPFEGVRAWILQGENHQLVFFQMEKDAKVPEHSHGYPQWGMVIEGEIDLIVDGKTWNCKKGDDYLIPAGAKHKANILTKSRVMDLFQERSRYRAKKAT
jgi:quercetin dioxygenase-like cupin family protein